MKILLALHNEKPNELLNNNLMYNLQTNELPIKYQNDFYSEIGKLFFCYDKKLINDDIIGFSQNKKFFYNLMNQHLINKDLSLDYKEILNNNDIIITYPITLKENNLLFHHCEGDIQQYLNNPLDILTYIDQLKYVFTDKEMNFLLSKNQISFHSIFIAKNEIFYDYIKYVKEKTLLYENLDIIKRLLNDNTITKRKKFLPWLNERLLNLYCFNKNLKIYYEHMIEKHIGDVFDGKYTMF